MQLSFDGFVRVTGVLHIRGPAYRCFLPDLTRFTGSYCAGPQSLLRSHQRTTALFIILYFASDRQSLSWYPEIFFSSGSSVSAALYTAFFRRRTPERKPASILPVSQRRRSLILLLASSAEIPLHRSPVPPEILPLPVCCRRLRRLEDNSSF